LGASEYLPLPALILSQRLLGMMEPSRGIAGTVVGVLARSLWAGERHAADLGHLPANAEPETLAPWTQFIHYCRAAEARAALLMAP
jgi:hypothetical protein